MNNNRKYSLVVIFLILILILIITSFYQCKSSLFSGDIVFIENGKIKLGFENKTGRLVIFNDLVNNHEFIDQSVVNGLPWEINFHSIQTNSTQTDEISPSKFSYSKPDPLTLILSWEEFNGIEELKVIAEITLDKKKDFSYWNRRAKRYRN